MSIATLTIDVNARLTNIEQSLDKIGFMAEKNAARVQASFAGAGTAIKASVAGLLASFSVGAVVQGFNGLVDSMDQLNDAADATGASIEKLSALQDTSAMNGHSVDLVTDSIVKLNQALGEKSDSEAGQALKAIGLSVQELQRLDPADAYRKVAEALNGFADSGDKARVIQSLFGKGIKEMAPLLKDVADSTERTGHVTQEQADASERLNKQLAQLQVRLKGAGQSIVGDLIPPLADLIERFNNAAKAGQDFGTTMARALGLRTLKDDIKASADEIERVDKQLFDLKQKGGSDDGLYGGRIRQLKQYREELMSNAKVLEREADLNRKVKEAAGDTGGGDKPVSFNPNSDADRRKVDEMLKRQREAADQVQKILDGIGFDPEQDKLLEDMNKQLSDSADRYKALADPAAKYREQLVEIQALGEKGLLNADEVDKATAAINKQIDAVGNNKSAVQEFGLTFTSSLEETIVKGEGVSKMLKGIEQDLIRIATRKTVTEPLMGAVGGLDLGSLFGGLFGGGATGYDTGAVDLGGSLASYLGSFAVGTPYIPHDGYAYLHKGERVMTAAENKDYSLAPSTVDTSAPQVSIQVINQGTPQKYEQTGMDWDGEALIVSVVATDIERDGPVGQALGRKYGLSAGAGAR